MRLRVVGTGWTTLHSRMAGGNSTRASASPITAPRHAQPRYLSWCTMRSAGGCSKKAERANAIDSGHASQLPHTSVASRPVRRRGAPQRGHSGAGGGRRSERQRRHARREVSPAAMRRSHARQMGGRKRSSRPRASWCTPAVSVDYLGVAIAARIASIGASISHQISNAAAACWSSISVPSIAGMPLAAARRDHAVPSGL